MLNKIVLVVGTLICSLILSVSVNAALLNISGGQLIGATGVIVQGSSYDVSFIDGTCAGLYSGCDENSDFLFSTPTSSRAAAQALLDQVFIGIFDDDPTLTRGCSAAVGCKVWFPMAIDPVYGLLAPAPVNRGVDRSDRIDNPSQLQPNYNTSLADSFTFAVWSVSPPPAQVPESSVLILLGLGLVGLFLKRRNGMVKI